MIKIVLVLPNDNHTLYIVLNNRQCIIYDLKPQLETIRFSILKDLAFFNTVKVKYGNTLVWDDVCQLTIDEIMKTVKK